MSGMICSRTRRGALPVGIESAAVPVHTLPDGRQFIADEDCMERREILDFVKRFPAYWVHDPWLCGYVAPPKDYHDVN